MSDRDADLEAGGGRETAAIPEFRLVITHPDRRGPLGPYRLAISVAFALIVSGSELVSALRDGRADDGALITAAAAALFVWVITTAVSKVLASAPRPIRSASSGADATS